MSAPRNEDWSFADDVDLLWSAMIEVCGGNVQTEIKAVYKELHKARYGEDVETARRKKK